MPAASTRERIGTSDEPTVEGMLSSRRARPWAVRYGAAVAAAALALALQTLLIPSFGVSPNTSPFMAFFAAVIVAAWFGGLGPGLLATALSALLSWYFFLSTQYSLEIGSFGQGLRVVVFTLEGAVISLLVGAMHSARQEAEANALEIRRSEQEIRAHAYQQQVVAELGQRALVSADLQNHMQDTVESVAGVLEVEYSKVLELLPGGEGLLLSAGVGWEEGLVGRATVGSGSDSQAGYTLLSEEPVIVEDLRSEARFSGPPLLHEHGVVSGMSVIISPGGRPFGVLGAYTRERREFTDDDVNFLRAVANVLAAAIERERAEERQRFLAETGALLSSSLDYRATLASVARLAVPTLADWCAVDVLKEDGSVERLAVEHEDPQKISLALKMQERYPPDPEALSGVPKVLRTGRPEFYPEVTDEMLEAVARDEEHLGLLREIGFTSAMIVPMVARGRTLGALILVSSQPGRRFGEVDLKLAEELGRRAALALDNARLYEEAQKEIAERERAQAELRRSRDELEVILGGVADGVTAQEPTGVVIYANETAARMVGYPSGRAFVEAPLQEVMERFEVFDEEGRPFPLEKLPGRRALQGEEGAEEVLRFRVIETGEERWSLVKAVPVFDAGGRVRMAVNIFRDVTERRRAEEERARLASIVESSVDAIISKTLDGTITTWNKGAERIYGYSAEETVGRSISMLVPPDRPDEIPRILESLRRGEKIEHFETVRVTKDGRRLDISLTVSPVRNASGDIVGASTIARDVTERKRSEDALREMREAERHRLARDLHDGVLQDLSYTTAAMELIMLDVEGTRQEGELQRVIEAVRRAAQGLRDVVNDLRLEEEQDRSLPELVESLVQRNRAMAQGCEISLKLEERFPPAPLGIVGTEMLRIIQEALTNARRHSGARNVIVSLRVEEGELVAEVADNGQGFGAGTVPGVGLESMRERAAVLGSRLEINSEVGQGTRVFLRVPMSQKG